mmetsp:Transcript_7502/g.10167  ORF Transcript_7502/g.10167 Transcript_7502/m.10167 type:complete len:389 (-) Transcript_7502:634-1800(-)
MSRLSPPITKMMKIVITFFICLSACSSFVMHHPGFVASKIKWEQKGIIIDKHTSTYLRSNYLLAKPEDGESDTSGDIYEAEEAAAIDAHDVSDPGMEGAAMERSVMMAQEMFAEEKNRSHEAHAKAEKASHKSNIPNSSLSDLEPGDVDDLVEAEEAAAIDAHDVSDPGMEGAAMERAVFLAQELIAQKREGPTKNKEQEKVSKEHIDVMETAAENLAHLINSSKKKKDHPEDYLALIEEADQEELSLLLLERAVMNAAVKVQEKAEERMTAATAAVEAAVEAKKFAAAFARRATEYAERKRKQALSGGSDAKASSDHDLSSVASHLAADAEYQLKLANDVEEKARTQEAEAKGSLEQIMEKESKLKADLKELHDLTQIGVNEETGQY